MTFYNPDIESPMLKSVKTPANLRENMKIQRGDELCHIWTVLTTRRKPKGTRAPKSRGFL